MVRGTVFLGRTNTLQTNPFNGNITNWPSSHSYVVSHTFNTNRMVNEARLAFSRNRTFFPPTDVLLNPSTLFTDASEAPLPSFVNAKAAPLEIEFPRITITVFLHIGHAAV